MYAGTLSRVHNVHTLVAAFRECCADVDFWIFGDGELKEMVVEATKEDSRIHYVGKVSRDDLLHAQKKAHVLISAKALPVT
jgi:glycosyltransferase involved in cell wall biosynthesis